MATPSNASDVDDHLASIEIGNSLYAANEPTFVRLYFSAQLLTFQGRHVESLPLFDVAFNEARNNFKDDFIWQNMYINIGTSYANTLDYLSMLEKAEEIFNELVTSNPTGQFLGDYAIFLHRRKKNFPQAQAFYIKALQLYPFQSSIHLKYAGFLRHIKKDLKNAEKHVRYSSMII